MKTKVYLDCCSCWVTFMVSSIFILMFSFIELDHKLKCSLFFIVALLSLTTRLPYISLKLILTKFMSTNMIVTTELWNIKFQLEFSYAFPSLTMLTCMAGSILVLIPKYITGNVINLNMFVWSNVGKCLNIIGGSFLYASLNGF